MRLQEDSMSMGDELERATQALRATPMPPIPTEAVARAEAIPAAGSAGRPWTFYLRSLAACAAVMAIPAIILVMLRGSGQMAFADVVQTIKQTHTFTGKLNITIPGSSGMHLDINVSVKGSAIRADSIAFTIIGDRTSRKILLLIPLLHQADIKDIDAQAKVPDIYGLLRDYRTGTEKALGEKTINGHKTQGFQLMRPADASGGVAEDWTFWVDPQTKLPVQIEFPGPDTDDPIVLSDLHFDVPLDDALFETKVPAGYTMMETNSAKGDPWDRRKYAGQVFDERGNPIAGVEVIATDRRDTQSPGAFGDFATPIKTDRDGRFSMDYGVPPKEGFGVGMGLTGLHATHTEGGEDEPIRLEFKHPDFLYGRLEDMNLLPPEQRNDLHVRLRDGKSITGRAVDSSGKPVAGAMVEAIYGGPARGRLGNNDVRRNYSKQAVTDTSGKFELHGLPSSETVVQVRRTDPALPLLWGQATVNLLELGTPPPVEIVAQPIQLPPGTAVHTLFGMKLVDVDDDVRNRLSLYPSEAILILEPGPNAARLGLGQVEQGDCFWNVDDARIKDTNDFARHLLAACEPQKRAGWATFSVRVIYTALRAGNDSDGHAHMRLTEQDLAELEKSVSP